MSLAKLSSAALGVFLLSACAHGGASARHCARAAQASQQRFVVLADQATRAEPAADSCAPTLKCDPFASDPHPWCPTSTPWAP